MGWGQARQASLAMAGAGALFEGHEEPLKGWKLRKKLCCINEHQKVTGGTRVMMGKGRQVPQEQFAPARGRDGTIRPEPVELVPALNLRATHQGGTRKKVLAKLHLGPRCPKSKRASKKYLLQASLLVLAASGVPWHVEGILPVSSYGLPSMCICLYIKISLLYKDISHHKLGPTLMTSP